MANLIREKQKASLLRMFELNDSDQLSAEGSTWSDEWKVLILDQESKDIISPLFSVAELRARGVTLHMTIDSKREKIPDVPAVYFVNPTEANLARIADDCAAGLYEKFYVNFADPLPRPLLESFAQDLVARGAARNIAKVVDRYSNFSSLDRTLFSFRMAQSFVQYQKPGLEERQIVSYVHSIAERLLAVFSTWGAPPIIHYKAGQPGPAAMVADRLHEITHQHVSHGSELFQRGGDGGSISMRPHVLIVDRSMDLAQPLSHTSTYQALLDDLIGMQLNRVTVQTVPTLDSAGGGGGGGASATKTYDLDSDTDLFWRRHAADVFPEAIEANAQELESIATKEKQLRGSTTAKAAAEAETEALAAAAEGGGMVDDSLSTAIESLPALLTRKKYLESHTNILHAIMEQVAQRDVPSFYDAETAEDKKQVLELLQAGKGTFEDRLRLVCIYALSADASKTDVTEVLRYLLAIDGITEEQKSLAAGILRYLESLRAVTSLVHHREAASASDAASPATSKWLSKFTDHTSSLISRATAGLRHMYGRDSSTALTRMVKDLLELKSAPQDKQSTFVTFDPKMSVKGDESMMAAARYSLGSAPLIVFVIGGGVYSEYHNLLAFAKEAGRSNIVYGSTEMLRPEAFLQQLHAVSGAS